MGRAAKTGDLHWRPLAAESRGFRYLAIAWVAVTIALFVASLLVGVESAAGDKFGSTDDINPVAVDTQLIPTGVAYGGLHWTHLETRMVPRANDRFSRPVIVVEMVASNVTGNSRIRVRSRDVSLVLDDGTRAPVSRFAHTASTSRIAVNPGTSQPATLVFKPSTDRDPVLSKLRLEIAEPNRHPAVLALGPDAELDPAFSAQTTEVDSTRAAEKRGLTLTTATIDLNAGTYRATVDEKLVIVQVQAVAGAVAIDSHYQPRSWRLESEDPGGGDLGPALWASDQPVPGTASDTIQLVFAVPVDVDLSHTALRLASENVKIGSIAADSTAK